MLGTPTYSDRLPGELTGFLVEKDHGRLNNSVSGQAIQVGVVNGDLTIFRRPFFRWSRKSLPKDSRSFLFEIYGQALRQADVTFRMSVIFMSSGAVIVLSVGLLALANSGPLGVDHVALLSGLSGTIITTCGGAFALHASRARKHLAKQADKLEQELLEDRMLENVLRLIGEIDDVALKDQIKSLTAMRVLGIGPNSETVTNRLLSKKDEVLDISEE